MARVSKHKTKQVLVAFYTDVLRVRFRNVHAELVRAVQEAYAEGIRVMGYDADMVRKGYGLAGDLLETENVVVLVDVPGLNLYNVAPSLGRYGVDPASVTINNLLKDIDPTGYRAWESVPVNMSIPSDIQSIIESALERNVDPEGSIDYLVEEIEDMKSLIAEAEFVEDEGERREILLNLQRERVKLRVRTEIQSKMVKQTDRVRSAIATYIKVFEDLTRLHNATKAAISRKTTRNSIEEACPELVPYMKEVLDASVCVIDGVEVADLAACMRIKDTC